MKRYFICAIVLFVIASVCYAEDRWALLVGIDRYSSDSISPLRGAAHDAMVLRDMLVKYGHFPSDNILHLTSDDKANLPNLGNIVVKLEYLASQVKQGDLFLFFFAGHGVSIEGKNYLLAYESDIRSSLLLEKTGLSVEELNAHLAKIQSGNVLLILDACRNSPPAGRGDEDNIMTDSFAKSFGVSRKEDGTKDIQFSATIYACKPGERAFEWPGKERGFFSITLEEALSGQADKDGDGKVTLNEVESYLSDRVPKLIKRELGSNRIQTPWVIRGGTGAGDMVLSWTTGKQQTAEAVSPSVSDSSASRALGETSDQGDTDKAKQKAEALLDELGDWELEKEESESGLTEQQKAEGWIEVTGEFYGADITPAEAQGKALEKARRNAVIVALGLENRSQEFLMRWETPQEFQQAFPALSQSTLYKGTVEKEEPAWTFENVQRNPGEPPVPLYRVTLKAKIAKEKIAPDPDFVVSLKLNNETFKEGDEMSLSITPVQDCYIAVFNILFDRTVLVMYPAQGRASKAVPSGTTFLLPSEAEHQQGGYFPVVSLSDKPEDVGSVLVVATKYNVPFLPEEAKEFRPGVAVPDGKMILPVYQAPLEEISRWLAGIPMDKRTFDVKQYKVKRE